MVLTVAIGDASSIEGTAVVCMPLDDAYIANSAVKLGVELALARGETRFAKSTGFPTGGVAAVGDQAHVASIGNRAWALASFEASPLKVREGLPIRVVDALDVTDVQQIIRKNLAFALLALLFAATVSVLVGSRLASMMSRALLRVNVGILKLAEQQYVHVDALKTGDELEALAAGFNTMVDGLKERDNLKTTMGKYMTSSVMEHLLSGTVKLGGETLTVTILFSDIRSFTTISEKMDPAQQLVGLLTEYYTDMVGIVMDSDGVVDKYIGDAVMAVFCAPVSKPGDAVNAVTAAVRMRQALKKLNERARSPRAPTPSDRDRDSHRRGGRGEHRERAADQEYTVIGDAVNLASRLESNTKELGVNVLISEDTWNLVKHAVEGRQVREITVKGAQSSFGDDVRSARAQRRAADRGTSERTAPRRR